MQRVASANNPPPPQGSRSLAVVLACVKEDAILVVGVVLVARVSCWVGIATCAHTNVMLPESNRQETVPNVLRNVPLLHVDGKIVHGRISRRMRAPGEEGAKRVGC
jgi:hypothetical protein